jgi:response regulator NasT
LDLVRSKQFDLAILDIGMPDMTGTELAGLLLTEHNLPAMFLSAYSNAELVEDAVSKGCLGYIVKPVDVPQLIPALEAALARARDLQALVKLKGQLEQALGNGRETSTAVGVLMERRGLTRQTAFDALRLHARSQGRRIEDVARELVDAAEALNSVNVPVKK